MTFLRLSRWDWIAFVAALALLLTMSADWWTTTTGEQCRREENAQRSTRGGAQGGQISEAVERDARECAERREKNAFQASAAIDRLIMLVLLVAIVAAVMAAFFRAAGRRFEPPLTPSAVAAGAGLAGALLVLYRILQPPGFNDAAVVKAGAPIGLALVGVLAVAARIASLAEREPPAEPEAEEPAPVSEGSDPSDEKSAETQAEEEAPVSEGSDPAETPPRWDVDEEEVTFEVRDEPERTEDEPPERTG